MPGPWISNADLKQLVADALKTVASLSPVTPLVCADSAFYGCATVRCRTTSWR